MLLKHQGTARLIVSRLSTEDDLIKEIVRFATLRKQRSIVARSVAKSKAKQL